MVFGWIGKNLRIDLSEKKVDENDLDMELARKFIGGRGLNVKLLYDSLEPGIDPLSPENPLIIGTGPLTGTLAPTSGRTNINAKSPLTGLLGDSNVGGHFGPTLKFAGYDNLIIHGQSDSPVYITICNENVEIRPGAHLWGLTTWETDRALKKELDDESVHVAAIGPAGENLIRYACIVCDKHRAAGRTGMGAVMGAKKLKAIAVSGDKDIAVSNPEEFMKVSKEAIHQISSSSGYDTFSKYGTMLTVDSATELGWLVSYNAKEAVFDKVEGIRPYIFRKRYRTRSKACFNCPIHCDQAYHFENGQDATDGAGIEYGTISAVGSNLGIDSWQFILWMNNFSNQMGFDSMSCGGVIAWALECYEKGVLTEEEVGMKLGWGDAESVKALTKMIVKRKGFGDRLAEGVKRAAQRIERGSEEYALHIKGAEMPYEVRGRKGFALGLAVANVGAVHTKGGPMLEYGGLTPSKGKGLFGVEETGDPRSYRGKAKLVVFTEHVFALASSLGLCKFASIANNIERLSVEDYASLLSAAVGWKVKSKEMWKIGERIINLERLFMLREGGKGSEDTLPKRFREEEVAHGSAKGERIDPLKFEAMLKEYYQTRGWNEEGVPTKEKLGELGL